MPAVPVTFNGVMFPKGKRVNDKPIPCVFVGYAWATGLGVGGGPVYPSGPPGGGGEHPEHPIVLPPTGEHPEHPIVLPEPPTELPPIPEDPNVVKPPPPGGGWGWSPAYGWGYFPGSGQPGPKK